MKIKRVQLKNGYKRFFNLTIDLGERPARIVALVGPNGCGKSSVLDGLLYHSSPWMQIGGTGTKDYRYHSMNGVAGFDASNVVVELVDGEYHSIREMKTITGHEKTMFSFRSSYRYNSNLMIKDVKAASEIRLNNYGATTSSALDDKMEENYRRISIKYNKYMRDNDCRPSEAILKIIGDLNKSIQKCLGLELSSVGDVESSRGTLYFKKPDHSTEFEFNVLSSGEKEVVDLLLDLYLRQDEYKDTIFLLDEPELHVSTAVQRRLLIEINRLIGVDCQLWIATHSIGFLRALQDEMKEDCQIIQFKDGVDWATSTQTLRPIMKTIASWREIFAIALDDLAHLVCPKRIVYCEGRDTPTRAGQERGFDATVYNNIFNEKYHETLFVSSGGNTELDQRSQIALAILTKVFSDVEILVLKDRDMASGQKTSEQDRRIYLDSNPSNHRVLKRWEIENYLFDKEVLQAYCNLKGLTFDEGGYDDYVTDIVNQNLKDATGYFRNFCGIITSISPEQFKISLSNCVSEGMKTYVELEGCVIARG